MMIPNLPDLMDRQEVIIVSPRQVIPPYLHTHQEMVVVQTNQSLLLGHLFIHQAILPLS